MTQQETTAERSDENAAPLRSVHTESFVRILDELRVSLIVSTYQAGKVAIVRSNDNCVDTLFRSFRKPMGIAVDGGRLAVGTGMHITEFHSFVPRWRPPFVSAIAPEDRCHLNGLCLVQGQPCFVTALGESDAPRGWRENKSDGGVLIEVSSGRVLCHGLSMPHSPRWYAGRLWILESGTGAVGYLDPKTLKFQRLVELPGFTRGLDFCGPFAFVGLSQVRETAIFSGIPITQRETERHSGVWAVNIETGEVAGFLQFEDAVQEVFAVQMLTGIQYPDLINDNDALIANSFELPDESLSDVPHIFSGGKP